MITILKGSGGELETVSEPTNGAWVKVSAPTPEEVERLQSEFDIPRDFIHHSLDMEERARVEKDNGSLLVVLRLPHFQGHQTAVPYTTVPIGIIITEKRLITICPKDGHVIRALAKSKAKDLTTDKPGRFLLQLLDVMAEGYLDYVRDINKAVDALEDKLQRSLRNEEVLGLLKYQKSLTYFTTGIKSNMLMLERLREEHIFGKSPTDADMLADVGIELQQAVEMVEISDNILSQMMDAFASIISNNLNQVMKFLASMTIVLTVPMLTASIYGMNVRLPLEDYPLAVVIIMSVAILLSIAVALVFWKKDWF